MQFLFQNSGTNRDRDKISDFFSGCKQGFGPKTPNTARNGANPTVYMCKSWRPNVSRYFRGKITFGRETQPDRTFFTKKSAVFARELDPIHDRITIASVLIRPRPRPQSAKIVYLHDTVYQRRIHAVFGDSRKPPRKITKIRILITVFGDVGICTRKCSGAQFPAYNKNQNFFSIFFQNSGPKIQKKISL